MYPRGIVYSNSESKTDLKTTKIIKEKEKEKQYILCCKQLIAILKEPSDIIILRDKDDKIHKIQKNVLQGSVNENSILLKVSEDIKEGKEIDLPYSNIIVSKFIDLIHLDDDFLISINQFVDLLELAEYCDVNLSVLERFYINSTRFITKTNNKINREVYFRLVSYYIIYYNNISKIEEVENIPNYYESLDDLFENVEIIIKKIGSKEVVKCWIKFIIKDSFHRIMLKHLNYIETHFDIIFQAEIITSIMKNKPGLLTMDCQEKVLSYIIKYDIDVNIESFRMQIPKSDILKVIVNTDLKLNINVKKSLMKYLTGVDKDENIGKILDLIYEAYKIGVNDKIKARKIFGEIKRKEAKEKKLQKLEEYILSKKS